MNEGSNARRSFFVRFLAAVATLFGLVSIAKADKPRLSVQRAGIESPVLQVNNRNGKEVIRVCSNGDVYVHGRLAANDQEVVRGLRCWAGLVRQAS